MGDVLQEKLDRALLVIQKLQARIAEHEAAAGDPIAILGTACRFPAGSSSPELFWKALVDGVDGVVELGDTRWPASDRPGTSWAGLVDAGLFEGFDSAFFGMAPREAVSMDPQQRVLLELAWEALERAGIPPDRLAGSPTGVYLGLCAVDYAEHVHGADAATLDAYGTTGTLGSVAAGRLSYLLGLEGPCMTIDTACSSSLVAIHEAINSLRLGQCTLALAAGVNLLLSRTTMEDMARTQALSPDGRCRAFDSRANGYVRAEGGAVVVLKRLAAAQRDGDPVLAVIRGSAINQDGRSTGLTTPNVRSQQTLLRSALADARRTAADYDYVEAHGTGTPLGDPIEVDALRAVLQGHACRLGSVKTNVGHTEAAAGLAGLLKVVLALEHERIPPMLHFRTLNPRIELDGLILVTREQPWPRSSRPRMAGVSSFGMSGTNAHLVVEEAPPAPPGGAAGVAILPLSARSPAALQALTARWIEALAADDVPLADLRYTAAVGKTHHPFRRAVGGETAGEVRAALEAARGATGTAPEAPPPVAFLFTGQGSQTPRMALGLYRTEPVFRAALDRCAAVLDPLLPRPLLTVLEDEGDAIHETGLTQPALFAVEWALAGLWRAWGVVPAAVMGHSVGELVAACVAGVFSVEDGLRLVAARGRLMQSLPGGGAMAAVRTGEDRLWPLLEGTEVAIAAVNGPQSVVVFADAEQVAALCARLQGEGVEVRRLVVSHAFHSARMDPMLEEFERVAATVRFSPPAVPMVSNLDGTLAADEVATPGYWVRHARGPVRFAAGVEVLARQGVGVYLEIGPQPILLGMAAACTPLEAGACVPSLRPPLTDAQSVAAAVGMLYVRGVPLAWKKLMTGRIVPVPSYPWQRERAWLEAPTGREAVRPGAGHPLLGPAIAVEGLWVWQRDVSLETLPWLADHRVGGAVVMPAAAFLDMALAAAREALGTGAVTVEDVVFRAALVLPSGGVRRLRTTGRDEGLGRLALRISSQQDDGSWTLHAEGAVRSGCGTTEPSATAGAEVSPEALYRHLAEQGLTYGPAFQGVRHLQGGVGEVALRPSEAVEAARYPVHPALLDAAFHTLLGALPQALARGAVVPVRVRRLQWCDPPPTTAPVMARGTVGPDGTVTGDLWLLDASGRVAVEVEGLECEPLPSSDEGLWWHRAWEPVPAVEAAPLAPGVWLILADAGGVGAALEARLRAGGEEVCTTLDAALDRPLRGVVHLRGLDATCDDLDQALRLEGVALLELMQGLARAGRRQHPRLWLVSRGTLAESPLRGFGRTLMLEHPEVQPVLVELRVDPPVDALLAELRSGSRDDEVSLRPDGRYVARLRRGLEPGARRGPARGRPYRVEMDAPGMLDRLVLRATEPRAPGPGEVGVAMEAAGLNFKDVVTALGLVPGGRFGLEGCGRVLAVGDGVTGLHLGQAVMVLAPGCLGSQVVVPAVLVRPRPAGLTAVQAATVTVAHLTAWHALHRVARLQPGERVLIHAASGGVGQAAFQWARHVGAEIYATAGTAGKRAALAAAGVRYVSDSRSLQFVDDVLRWTGGEGVDVVLNSLSGPFLKKSLTLLRDGGRFVELGMRDVLSDTPVGLRPFLRNLSFSLVDLAGMTVRQPQQVRQAWDEVMALVERGVLKPLPYRTVPVAGVAEAFRTMAQGHHTGKLVVTFDDDQVPVEAGRMSFRGEGSWIVTGGTGGVGQALVRWLVEQGAGRVVLLSRSGGVGEVPAGAAVEGVAVDVADPTRLAGVLAGLRPIRGVFHAAGVLDDGLLLQQSEARMQRVWAPKVQGAWNLHRLTADDALDCFVLFSSLSALLGSAGQAAYAAGNAFLDGLAAWRREQGQVALSVNWGPFASVGMAARQGERLGARGVAALSPAAGLAVLGRLLDAGAGQVGVASLRVRQWVEFHPQMAGSSFLAGVQDDPGPGGAAPWRAALQARAPGEGPGVLEALVAAEVAQVLRMDAAGLDPQMPLKRLGIDSLMGLELRNRLEAGTGLRLSPTLLWAYPTIARLGAHLYRELEPTAVQAEGGPEGPAPWSAGALDGVSDDEADAMLRQTLEDLKEFTV